MKQLKYKYDTKNDVMEIEGVKYSGDLFRELGSNGMNTGQLFKLMARDCCGKVTIQRFYLNPGSNCPLCGEYKKPTPMGWE